MTLVAVSCHTASDGESLCEVHRYGCADIARTLRRRGSSVHPIEAEPTDEAVGRLLADRWFYPGAYDRGEVPDYRLMPCTRRG